MWTGHSPFLYVDGPSSQTDPVGVEISEADVWKVPRSKCWEWSLHRILERDTWNKQQILSGETAWMQVIPVKCLVWNEPWGLVVVSRHLCCCWRWWLLLWPLSHFHYHIIILSCYHIVILMMMVMMMMMSMMLVVVVMITARAIAAIPFENYHSPRPEKSSWRVLYKAPTAITEYIYIYLSLSLRVCVFESTDYNIYNYKTIMSFYFTTATPTHKLVMFTNFVI